MSGIGLNEIQEALARVAQEPEMDAGASRRGVRPRLQIVSALRTGHQTESGATHAGEDCQGLRHRRPRIAGVSAPADLGSQSVQPQNGETQIDELTLGELNLCHGRGQGPGLGASMKSSPRPQPTPCLATNAGGQAIQSHRHKGDDQTVNDCAYEDLAKRVWRVVCRVLVADQIREPEEAQKERAEY